ncbi:MAG: hypothetical protein HYV63_07230 [Candidatus Schekmanbacteria bacterium]|nr:hypothetical protein [Candidatus Schekmanbacteria bacterium]
MSNLDYSKLSGKNPDCPSELLLDRFHGGELPSAESAAVERHSAQCPACTARLALRQRGAAAFPALRLDEVADKCVRLDAQRRVCRTYRSSVWQRFAERLSATRRVHLSWIAAAATAAAAIFVALLPQLRHDGGIDGTGIHMKGGPRLHVVRERSGAVAELADGELVRAGDRLQFRVDLPADAEVMVVGVESSGAIYPCYPLGASGSTAARAGAGIALAGAVELDDSAGDEYLHLVVCPRHFALHNLSAPARGAMAVAGGDGCRSDSIHIVKEVP